MKVLDFIRFNEDWEARLAEAPYFIKASWDGNYVLLKYNQLASDFNNEIVRECRGCIFSIPDGGHNWADIVCYPFDKFGNYGESYVPAINWSTAKVKEKVDGSLIKVWYHRDKWHVSTNGTIDARKAPTSVEGVSFYDVFMRALEKNGNPDKFFQALDINYTYMFELVSPETRVTIEYPEAAIYYLGARSMLHFNEVDYPPTTEDYDFFSFVKLPATYPLTTLQSCIEAVNAMGADEEGFVVCDNCFNRVKIKSPEYLIASKVRNNGAITIKRIIEAMRAGYLDDLYAYAPDHRKFIDSVLDAYKDIALKLTSVYAEALEADCPESTPWFMVVKTEVDPIYHDYCYKRHAGKIHGSYEYLDKLSVKSLADWIKDWTK